MIELISLMILPLLGAINSQNFPDVLTQAEENKYLKAWENKDFEARNKLIEHNLRLVAHIVKKFENTGIDKDDLLSIGTFGLIKAVDTFNFNATNKLATYAAKCIENEILMHFRSLKKTAQDVSINDPIETDKEGNDLSLIDVIADDSNIFDKIDLRIKTENLKKFMNEVLTPREKIIISLRFGLISGKENTQREVAEKLNISRSYVSRIEKKALKKLYDKFETTKL